MHIKHPYCTLLSRRGAAYALVEGYGLACYTALEGTEDEGGRGRGRGGVEGIETGPVDVVGRGGAGKGRVGVVEEGGSVGEVAAGRWR